VLAVGNAVAVTLLFVLFFVTPINTHTRTRGACIHICTSFGELFGAFCVRKQAAGLTILRTGGAASLSDTN